MSDRKKIVSEANKITDFLVYTEGLKRELRNTWLSDNRRESSAEHTCNMALLAMVLCPKLEKDIDVDKVIKMCLVHDLSEIEAGDLPACEYLGDVRLTEKRHKEEKKAIANISKIIGEETGGGMIDLWHEFELQKTEEAKIAKYIDKLEGRIQKSLQKKELTENEHKASFIAAYKELMDNLAGSDPLLLELSSIADRRRRQMMREKGK